MVPAGHLEDEEGKARSGAVRIGRRRGEAKNAIRKTEVDN